MKFFLSLLFLLPVITKAQDSVLVITPSMFDKTTDEIFIAGMDGWVFQTGNDSTWANENFNATTWKKFKPTDLSTGLADKTGRVEGWFRIKIRLIDSLMNKPLQIKQIGWAASDLFINGRLIHSVGNTGLNGKPYAESNPNGRLPFPADLKPGTDYLLAFHVVDYVTPLPPYSLKSKQYGLNSLVRLAGPGYSTYWVNSVRLQDIYFIGWISVCAVLSILFWLLYLQNKEERNLRLIALGTTSQMLVLYSAYMINGYDISFSEYLFYSFVQNMGAALTSIFTVLILTTIFKRKITTGVKVFLVLYFLGQLINFFLKSGISNPVLAISNLLISILCVYYTISSWKTLRGAQWPIVAGLFLGLLCGIIYFILISVYENVSIGTTSFIITGYSLSFPLSLLVYVSMRFKEIIKDVRQNAAQVLQLSEEKEQQALTQQTVLQEEVKRQTAEIRNTLDNLKSTQTQLVQSEKMASLGELTAGIAHEIQNPLNFVNNFSEVSNELIDEMKEELKNGNNIDAVAIADDIKQNLEKINHHGKRADAIVKGMLQHSRSSSGVKEPTDINTLCDEYLRLSYHGLRAKDKSFNATIKTDFDPSLEKINIIPQDIGRVVLNLLTNAFYVVDEKKKSLSAVTTPTADTDVKSQETVNYEPTVSITTKKVNDKVEIKVTDNGNGIPQKLLDKIFQPFFTTKPTGQGTGLGLSLSYDIVTKGHGGELKVETKENEGTTFTIQIPT
ncbi:MAG: ATP-binding protein [Ferruginibacter sp.]